MSSQYVGDPTASQSPSPAPSVGGAPIVVLPADGDSFAASSVAQAFKTLADFAAFMSTYSFYTSRFFGDGVDGNVTLSSGVTTTPVRDMYYNNLTVPSGATLSTANYRIHVKGTCTVSGTISCVGGNAVSNTAGAPLAWGTLIGGTTGGIGSPSGSAGTNTVGTAIVNSYGGSGGASCPGTGSTKAGGNATAPSASMGSYKSLPSLLTGVLFGAGGTSTGTARCIGGGAGGGGGDNGGGGTPAGGGGGAGGGFVMLLANSIVFSGGNISANGGAGASAGLTTGSAGGGGGGGGGVVFMVYQTVTGTVSVTASGGAGGITSGGIAAQNGTSGSNGTVIQWQL